MNHQQPLAKHNLQWANIAPLLLGGLVLISYWALSIYLIAGVPQQAHDPEYAYFLSALAPFKGAGYTYIDHPGTPLELIGTVILGFSYPFVANSPDGFIRYQLEHPALFLGFVHVFLLATSVSCVVVFYYTARSTAGLRDSLASIALALMFYILHGSSLVTLLYWSHNSFNFPFGTLFLLFLFRAVQHDREIPLKTILGLGLFAGLLTAVVIYFATWVIAADITIAGLYMAQRLPWKKTLAALAIFQLAGLAGFILATLPILGRLALFRDWMIQLIVHQGRYGTGPEGITTPSLLRSNFATLFQDMPVLILSVAAILALSIWAMLAWRKRIATAPGLWALALGLTIQIVIAFAIILKHPGNNDYYLLALAAIAPVLMLVVRKLFEHQKSLRTYLDGMLIAAVLIGLAINFMNSLEIQSERVSNLLAMQNLVSEEVKDRSILTGRKPQEVVIVWGYGVYDNCNSLVRMNNNYIKAFNDELAAMCPNQYVINDSLIFNGQATSSDGKALDINSLAWDLLFTPETNAAHMLGYLKPGFKTERLGDVKTGLPGYKVEQPVLVIRKGP